MSPTAHGASGKVGGNVSYPTWQAWQKPLAQPAGARAVLVINLSERPQDVSVSFKSLGVAQGRRVAATDAWTGAPAPSAVGAHGLSLAGVASHDSVFLVLES